MSSLAPLLTACPLRPIQQAADQYAADLIRGLDEELADSTRAEDFLDTTHLTKPTADFLRMAMSRVDPGRDSTSPSVYQLYSRYGGGKTHSLLLLAAAAKYPSLPYWRSQTAADIHPVHANVVAFSGERHDVVSGAELDHGRRAKSLAGYLLYRLAGPDALQAFQDGDDALADPGADAFLRAIADQPTLIVIDELVQYVSRVNQRAAFDPRVSTEGVLTTLSALANAVANSPRAALVITTPEDSHKLLQDAPAPQPQGDAYSTDALDLTEMLERVNSQLGRVLHPVAPSGEADLPAILRKRLFRSIDPDARQQTASAYAEIADRNGRAANLDYQTFHDDYPFHPSLLRIITGRLAANRNFQRVRGTLRLLGNALLHLQNDNNDSNDNHAALLHPYHLTPEDRAIRDELINRPGFPQLDPAIDTDIVGPNSTAAKINHPLARPAAITMLLGSIAPDASNGLYADQIADALLAPHQDDFGIIADALDQFLSRAIYVDDSPDTQRIRFSKDANVMKELLEARDAIRSNTKTMSDLLRQSITRAYEAGNQRDRFKLVLFPSRESNLPDQPDQAALGIVQPDFWNWTDARSAATGMSEQDLLDLHRHSSANGGDAPRQYPNNALLLAAHDANLSRIRDQIATAEAAQRLLRDPSRPLPPHRLDTLREQQTAAQKNAITDIQNKFTHLFSAGNSPQHQWPPQTNSHIEHRVLDSLTDAAGKGQKRILELLGDRVLHGEHAGLSKNAWANVGIIANPDGATLAELRDYSARVPDMRIIIDDPTWRAIIQNGVANGALHVETPRGEINPNGYDPSWRVWAAGHRPKSPKPPPPPPPPPPPGPLSTLKTDKKPGAIAYKDVREFMRANQHDWPALVSCRVTGTKPALADQIASAAQGENDGIAISMSGRNQRLQVSIRNAPPSEFKDYAASARKLLERAAIHDVDVTVALEPHAAPRILERLNNHHEAKIEVAFQPPQPQSATQPPLETPPPQPAPTSGPQSTQPR